jgi:hypothetical protein
MDIDPGGLADLTVNVRIPNFLGYIEIEYGVLPELPFEFIQPVLF